MISVMARVVRTSIVLLAVVACAWFALAIRAAHNSNRVSAIVSGQAPLTAAEAAHARSLLDAPRTLNPDTAVDLLRAKVALGTQRRGEWGADDPGRHRPRAAQPAGMGGAGASYAAPKLAPCC